MPRDPVEPCPASGLFRGYDDPRSGFSRRLVVVQRVIREILDAMPPGPIVIVDICAGVGRPLLPVLRGHRRMRDVRAWLIEVDHASAEQAREEIRRQGLASVQVIEADAGHSETFVGIDRAHLVILSGVLAHLSRADRRRTIGFLPEICAPGAMLVWTIGNRWDPSRIARVRQQVRSGGFAPLALHGVARFPWGRGQRHEVGVARLTGAPGPLVPGVRIFAFQPTLIERHPRIRGLIGPIARVVRRATRR